LITLQIRSDASATSSDRKTELRTIVERHIDRPDIGLKFLSDVVGASRATIYRAFSESGGLHGYILKRRLDRAFHELASTPRSRGIVKAVVERWHFASASHFSNAFMDRFGLRPSQVVGLSVLGPTAEQDASQKEMPAHVRAAQIQLQKVYERFTSE
jgi:AraC-like DNA-binding protein